MNEFLPKNSQMRWANSDAQKGPNQVDKINGVIIGVDINGGETPIFLWVDRKTKKIDFSPAELYRPIWDKQLP